MKQDMDQEPTPGYEYAMRAGNNPAIALRRVLFINRDGKSYGIVRYLTGPRSGHSSRVALSTLRVRWELRQPLVDDDAQAVYLEGIAKRQWKQIGSATMEGALTIIYHMLGVSLDPCFTTRPVLDLGVEHMAALAHHLPALSIPSAFGPDAYQDRAGAYHLPPQYALQVGRQLATAAPRELERAIASFAAEGARLRKESPNHHRTSESDAHAVAAAQEWADHPSAAPEPEPPRPRRRPLTDRDLFRFRAMIRKTNECWLWEGRLEKAAWVQGDHGALMVDEKPISARKLAYELANGQAVPDGKWPRVQCKNGLCVRPDHLVLMPKTVAGLEPEEDRAWTERSPESVINTHAESRTHFFQEYGAVLILACLNERCFTTTVILRIARPWFFPQAFICPTCQERLFLRSIEARYTKVTEEASESYHAHTEPDPPTEEEQEILDLLQPIRQQLLQSSEHDIKAVCERTVETIEGVLIAKHKPTDILDRNLESILTILRSVRERLKSPTNDSDYSAAQEDAVEHIEAYLMDRQQPIPPIPERTEQGGS